MNTFLEMEDLTVSIKKVVHNGVAVFKELITPHKMRLMTQEILRNREVIFSKINSMERPLKTYSDIAERELGRLDFRCGFNADIFHQIEHPIIKIINAISPQITFRHYWGAITSLGGAGPTDLHRDVYPILNTCQDNDLDLLDINLPPYYFTVLMPLIKITHENGPTEFVQGSHREGFVDIDHAETYAPLLKPGDAVIFDGRTLHRGMANKTQNERMLAYITFVANWYHDQTFEINNYLFP